MDNDTFTDLTYRQRRAIEMIAHGEANGIPLTRLLKTVYSCRWCGQIVGQSGDTRDRRKLLLLGHETECNKGGEKSEWVFATSATTFYKTWKDDKHFMEALESARSFITSEAMRTAAARLQASTLDAANELARQITEGEKDYDRRSASIAVLDRADVSTAKKVNDPYAEWLAELRGDDDKTQEE